MHVLAFVFVAERKRERERESVCVNTQVCVWLGVCAYGEVRGVVDIPLALLVVFILIK